MKRRATRKKTYDSNLFNDIFRYYQRNNGSTIFELRNVFPNVGKDFIRFFVFAIRNLDIIKDVFTKKYEVISDNNLYRDLYMFKSLYETGNSLTDIMRELNCGKNKIERFNLIYRFKDSILNICKDEDIDVVENEVIKDDNVDEEILRENVRMAKSLQKVRDTNRVQNKAFREHSRIENTIESYNKEIINLLKNYEFKLNKENVIFEEISDAVGIIHITDTHFNEFINIPGNKFDFNIANKRIKKYISRSISYFNMNNVKTILVAFTGDILNSDRRLDEMMVNITNRSNATFLAIDILENALLELSQHFNVHVACVSGNESRIKDEPGYSDLVATDNYDFTIYNIMKCIFRKTKIKFYDNGPGNYLEYVINIMDKNILLCHGNAKGCNATENYISKLNSKWGKRGVKLDLILLGHIHSPYIGDGFSRGGSLPGANDYSDKGLNLTSKACLTSHILRRNDPDIESIKIELQNTANYIGYDINDSLEAYAPRKSEENQTTILKIVT